MQTVIFILSILLVIASAFAGIRGHRLSMKNSPFKIDNERLERYQAEEHSRPSLQDVISKNLHRTFAKDSALEVKNKEAAS